ncbi:non-ribosomal peptide synthetase terminal domain of unknown function [Blastococcus mobilis]|uniref:Carrier domain-containing protein n=2 Tax=Blastococcus mobilis TaxID=1938746 RepID=A0A239AKL1_9ACTN|nr:non-ribosomal peptide synthetase terminal domain of unknown function [Blastococcus mobilis]
MQHLFEARCDELRNDGRSGQLAVDAGDVVLTYDELDSRANQLARYLLACGARPGDRIGLLFDSPLHSYIGMLAVLKINAAYVPLDVGFPPDRLRYITDDARVGVMLTLSHLRQRLDQVDASFIFVDEVARLVAAEPPGRLTDEEAGEPVDQLAYLIYTSGTTGRPKGVAIEHGSICNFVRVAVEVYGITSSDRVYQGMTIAFDFSVEEIWVPWIAGATLVPKPGGSSLLGAELGEFLQCKRITALCCVPTLLATLDEDVPGLRFLLVSGEACPQELVARWHRPGRRFLNVYGPTEATVTATWTSVHPDRPVTLGVPLPTYSIVILDADEARALPRGEMGEIGIAGIGLAIGYLNRPDLTEKVFIPDFLGLDNNPSGRIYRTGDLGRINAYGELEYHGRIDTQVKIRGYRIELTEIESLLAQVPGIAQAVVNTYEPEPGTVELVGYYSLRKDTASVDKELIYRRLRERLPAYMVPAYLEELDIIPMTSSDKADRKSLPAPRNRHSGEPQQAYVAPSTTTEETLADALAEILRLDRVSVLSHFFDDLGANSLLMAQFCSGLRKRSGLPSIAMRDVYLHPTVKSLAVTLGDTPPTVADTHGTSAPEKAVKPGSTRQYVLCGALQLLAFFGYMCLSSLVLVSGFEWVAGGTKVIDIYQRTLVFGAGSFLGFSALPIVAKWLLIGRWKPQEIPVWSLSYFRFWLVKTLVRSSPLAAFVGSPIYVFYLRMLGAKIGRGVAIFTHTMPVCTDLLTIGDGTVIRKDSFLPGYRAHAGVIQTGAITIGKGVLIGEKTVLDIGTSLGDAAQLGHVSSLHEPQAVPAGERWHGSPAQRTDTDYRTVPPARCGALRRGSYATWQLATVLVLYVPVGMVLAGSLLPDVLAADYTALTDWTFYRNLLALTFVMFFGAVLTGLIFVVTVPRALNLALTPGKVYPLYGIHYMIQRTITRMTNVRFYVDFFGDSSYIVHYLRALGYNLSQVQQTGSNFGTELGHESPYLTTVGSGTMVSDALSVMNRDVSSTSFRLSQVSIGERNFLGNNIAYPSQSKVGANCLLATKVMVPIDGPVRENVGLLGSPCFEIPRSVQRDAGFDHLKTGDELERSISAKNRHNIVTMATFLLVRWYLVFCLAVLAAVAAGFYDELGATAVAAFGVAALLFSLAYSVFVERAVQRFRPMSPRFCSIYDRYFWGHERFWKLIATVPFHGTPFKNLMWRLLGVRIGRRVFDDGCSIPEKSLVTIGDDCTLNAGSVIQCHSLEDGTFKSDFTTLGAGCTLGIESFVHYGVTMSDGAVLDADAFLMKGEEVARFARWRGNPAQELHPPGVRPTTTPAPAALPAAPPAIPAGSPALASLLRELRANPGPRLPRSSGVALSLFTLDACRHREAELITFLSSEEVHESDALSSSERRDAFVISRALVRLTLSAEWCPDVPPRDWRFGRTELGKLTVVTPADTGLDVSISHTAQVIALALSVTHDVGVDVEAVADHEDPVVWSVLSPAERVRLEAQPVPDRRSEFLRAWTLKEAFVKCTGAGSSHGFQHLDTRLEPLAVLTDDCQQPSSPVSCEFHQEKWQLADQCHWVAVATRPRRPHRDPRERHRESPEGH